MRHEYVPVALDGWNEPRRQDAAGLFYRKIVSQNPEINPDGSTQGLFICTPDGKLVNGWNNRSSAVLSGQLHRALGKVRAGHVSLGPAPRAAGREDRQARRAPAGARVLDVHCRILKGTWAADPNKYEARARKHVGRDKMWILKSEIAAMRKGKLPAALARRLVRFHLIDNTRGEPPMWAPRDVKRVDLALSPAGAGSFTLSGHASVATPDGLRGYTAALRGTIVFDGPALRRCDIVSRGSYWGNGPYTRDPPEGRFEVGVSFRLAAGGIGMTVPPQGTRNLDGYLQPR
ncbi:MAG: hypothetical protein OER88_12490 [Planctomycetota bacterium]|nr:hypothetical protein [Planctomycetota bacterium]